MRWDFTEASIFYSKESGRRSFTCCSVFSLSSASVVSAGDAMPLKMRFSLENSGFSQLLCRKAVEWLSEQTPYFHYSL